MSERSGEAQWFSVEQFPPSPTASGGLLSGPHIVLIFFSIMLREAKENLPDGIYIRFRANGSLFNLRRLLERTKTIEELMS